MTRHILAVTLALLFAGALTAQSVIGSVLIGSQPPGRLGHDPGASRVYVSGSFAQLSTQVIDVSIPSSPSVVTTVPLAGVAVNPATGTYYGSTGFGGQVQSRSVATDSIITNTFIGFCGGMLEIDTTNDLVLTVSQCGGGNDPLHVLSGALAPLAGPLGSGGVVSTVELNTSTGLAHVSRSGGTRVFGPAPSWPVVTDLPGAIVAINPVLDIAYYIQGTDLVLRDGTSHAVLASIAGGAGSGGFGVDEVGHRLYVPDWANGDIVVRDGVTGGFITTFQLGAGVQPRNILVDGAGAQAFVHATDNGTEALYVIDLFDCSANPGQTNTTDASLRCNGVGPLNCNGPFAVDMPAGDPLTLDWDGPANMPLVLIAGPLNPANASLSCLGTIDIGTPPTYSDITIVFDGNQPGLPGALFLTGNSGTAHHAFTTPSTPGLLGHVQGVVFQPAGGSCSALLTAAFSINLQ